MKKVTNVLSVLSMLLMSQTASAAICSLSQVTLGLTGVDGGNSKIFAGVSSSSNNDCGCSHVRFLAENSDTKMILSILLSAKLAGKTVRIDITDELDCNSASRAYIE